MLIKKYHDPGFGEITQPVSSDPGTHVKLDTVAGIYKPCLKVLEVERQVGPRSCTGTQGMLI